MTTSRFTKHKETPSTYNFTADKVINNSLNIMPLRKQPPYSKRGVHANLSISPHKSIDARHRESSRTYRVLHRYICADAEAGKHYLFFPFTWQRHSAVMPSSAKCRSGDKIGFCSVKWMRKTYAGNLFYLSDEKNITLYFLFNCNCKQESGGKRTCYLIGNIRYLTWLS